MIDLTPLFNAFIAIMAALAVRYLVPWLKSRTTAAQREDLFAWVKIAVAAAEQLYDSSQGEEKLDYVMAFLIEKGLYVDGKAVNNAIEAEVLKLHKELKNGQR